MAEVVCAKCRDAVCGDVYCIGCVNDLQRESYDNGWNDGHREGFEKGYDEGKKMKGET